MLDSLKSTARAIRRRNATAVLSVAVAVGAGLVGVDYAAAFQDQVARPSIRPPEALTAACEMERSPLSVDVVASSLDHYPRHAERIPGGWLIYDRYDRQVVELADDLREVARWGREGPGPLEYGGRVRGLGRTESGSTFVVDDSPPAVMMFGGPGEEYRLDVPRPHHAVRLDDRLLIASSAGIHETTFSHDGEVATPWSHEDLAIPVSERGKSSRYWLRKSSNGSVYAAATSQSAIWLLNGEENVPRKVVQRCVPNAWREMHVASRSSMIALYGSSFDGAGPRGPYRTGSASHSRSNCPVSIQW